MMIQYITAVWAGFLLDCILGDPQGWWHPVRTMGWLIQSLEKPLRKAFPKTDRGQLWAGACLVLWVTGSTVMVSGGILLFAYRIHPVLGWIISSIMSWQILAARSLKTESMKVYNALVQADANQIASNQADLEPARYAVSRIVGRDTAALDAAGITRAAVETVAENTSDGVIAPLCWTLILGPVGGFFYKAVNTMDSMVGYKNDSYLYYGRAAAYLDDVVNFIPARLAALLLILSAWILPGMDGRAAWHIWRRDRHCHKSPNSAQGESACAGALHLQLAGPVCYFGVLHEKPTIGDNIRPIEPADIIRVNGLMYLTTLLTLLAGTGGILWLSHITAGMSIGM